MSIKIALAGNPNSGKTTLFNALTGSNQFVGNWPGVTVEKKEGRLKGNKNIVFVDLPGIYSLSPYTLEEVIARNYLINERPNAILNIVDGTNIERNLYLTTQLLELGIPVVVAVNMIDVVNKSGDKIHLDKLSKALGCEVVAVSALKGTGITEAAERAVAVAKAEGGSRPIHKFSDELEEALFAIEGMLSKDILAEQRRFFAIKLFESDDKITDLMKNVPDVSKIVADIENFYDDDAESIITNERYQHISSIIQSSVKKNKQGAMTTSDKIDRIVTNRWLALPIFALVMFLIYFISITTVGTWATDWANDGLFGDGYHLFSIGAGGYEEASDEYAEPAAIISAFERAAAEADVEPEEAADLKTIAYIYDDDGNIEEEIEADHNLYMQSIELEEPDPSEYGVWLPGIPVLVEGALERLGTADWLNGLILDGIVAGVGAVLGFVPQMLVLFFLLAFLEGCGYMARIAFILDRIFRKFGLSGKSFIPMLIGTGCSVPGIMASRTIENDRDRKMTIMTTSFMPCGAKLPIIALIAGALFDGAWWVAPSAYFVGIAAIVMSGIILKKSRIFEGDPAPFVMELPSYHLPTLGNLLRGMWERGWSFIKKAGTIILLSSVVIWFLMSFGIVDGKFMMVEDLSDGFLSIIGNAVAWIFAPLGWGHWQAAVATVTGLVAKENVVGSFGVLYGFAEVTEVGAEIWGTLASSFTVLSAYSFLIFNLLCAPCFAAMGAIKREMNNGKWTLFAIGYQTVLAYAASLCVYQFGMLITQGIFGIGTVAALIVFGVFLYLLFRPAKGLKKSKSLS